MKIKIDNSSYMNMPWRHDLIIIENGKEVHLGYTDDAELASEDDSVFLDESVAVIQYWQHLDKEQLKELHDNLEETVEDDFNILYQDGSEYYTIDDIL